MWWQTVLRAVGRGTLVLLRVLLWEPLVEIVHGLARGAGDVIRRLMPWAMGAGAVWGLLVFAPELFQMLLVLGIMLFGLKIVIRAFLPTPKKRRK